MGAFEVNTLEPTENTARTGGTTSNVVEDVADVVIEKAEGCVFSLNAEVEIFVSETHIAGDVGLSDGAFRHIGLKANGLSIGFEATAYASVAEIGVVEAETGNVEEGRQARFIAFVGLYDGTSAGATGKANDLESGKCE